MLCIVGSFSFLANRFLSSRKFFPYWVAVPLKSWSFWFKLCLIICSCIMVANFDDILKTRLAPCLAVVGRTILCSNSTSFTFKLCISMGRSPVSLLNVSLVHIILLAFEISISTFSVVGGIIDFGSGS